MTDFRQILLRFNALFLIVASTGGLIADVAGAFFGQGPWAPVLRAAPLAGIGFIEAHGLALIIGVMLWRVAPSRSWHFATAAVHALLGTCNLIFWQVFIVTDNLATGYITTGFHGLLVVLQIWAGVTLAPRREDRSIARHSNPRSP